jgi:hypothetical protein
MYKIITHTIKEEHFDHPMTAEAAMTRGNVMPKTAGTSSVINQLSTTLALVYRSRVRSQFETYLFHIRNYVLSAFNGGEDLAAVEKNIVSHAKVMAMLLSPYYSDEVVEAAEAKLVDYSKHLLAVVQAIKSDSGVADAEAKLTQVIKVVADTFESVNSYWPSSAVNDHLTKFANSVAKQARARKSKNWAEDMEALAASQMCWLSGDLGVPGYLSFAEVFARGVILEFPQKFADFRIVY